MSNAILNLPQGVHDYISRDLDLVRNRSAAEDAIYDAHRIHETVAAFEYAGVITNVQRAVIAAAAVDALRECFVRLFGR